MNKFFPEIKNNFGFGCMRFPRIGDGIDTEQIDKMVDLFIENGFNYFDTAHGYMEGRSETTLKQCLTSRHDRSEYILADKLSNSYYEKEEEIAPLVDAELDACGVEYFDFFLVHCIQKTYYEKCQRLHVFEHLMALKEAGKIRHLGMSYHDKPDLLEEVLTAHPEIEFVQIQYNFVDYDDPVVCARGNYEVCAKHNVPVFVMEPVRGGSLVNLPEEVLKPLTDLKGGSPASYAIRFATDNENVAITLSGMSTLQQMEENISFMKDFKPLTAEEKDAIQQVVKNVKSLALVPCTACHYCTDGCPMHIRIPELFRMINLRREFGANPFQKQHYEHLTGEGNKASDCIECGQCEAACPQFIAIRDQLKVVAKEFED